MRGGFGFESTEIFLLAKAIKILSGVSTLYTSLGAKLFLKIFLALIGPARSAVIVRYGISVNLNLHPIITNGNCPDPTIEQLH